VWLLSTGEDLRFPTTMGDRPGLAARGFQRYADRLMEVGTERADVHLAVLRVLQLLRPPASLFRPSLVAAALRGQQSASPVAPPGRAAEPLSPVRDGLFADTSRW
jgi:hypothetical protein